MVEHREVEEEWIDRDGEDAAQHEKLIPEEERFVLRIEDFLFRYFQILREDDFGHAGAERPTEGFDSVGAPLNSSSERFGRILWLRSANEWQWEAF